MSKHTPRRWSFDDKCYELAEHFAQGESMSEDELKDLAQLIQDACEDYLRYRESQAEAAALATTEVQS